MKFRQYVTYETKCSGGGGGYCCDTVCCILNCSLELLGLLLMLGTFFLPAFCVDAYAGIEPNHNAPGTLGVCNIANPTYDTRNGNEIPYPSEYNRVYFGWIPTETTGTIDGTSPYGSTTNVPMYWRVLNTVDFSGIPLPI